MLKPYFYFCLFILISFISCKKSTDPEINPDNTPKLEGGKGGDFEVAFFSKANGVGVSSRMYLKYAADKMPADTSLYDEEGKTITEPGFGPHVHFEELKKGTYYLFAKSASAQGDTVFTLTDSSKKDQDIIINLK